MTVTEIDVQVALCELQVAGLIEFLPDNEAYFHITDKGRKHGKEILDRFPVKDRLILVMLRDELEDTLENVE